ncbi:flagellar biosynthetic protein FliR [Futiania mangrovi]|uniref:Flagellar biosynthetic protein FliR n=1 Tax=Futiania mangrovi TaxID=2959716 RepID=A0A9J6PG85_9PROT|nr:flagellar biosynthetic protein FliR [Futiania mangrovii]MCP1336811.1 flagellar biosynthetic protein FliR [Futiania mangrovii]
MSLDLDLLWPALAAFVRIGAMMALMPGFGGGRVPMRIALGLALLLTLAVMPSAGPVEPPASGTDLVSLVVPEAIAGLMLGTLVRAMLFALQIAGAAIAQSIGIAHIFGGVAEGGEAPVGSLVTLAGLTAFYVSGLHIAAIAALADSYRYLPAGTLAPAGDSAWAVVEAGAQALTLGLRIAAPLLVAGFLYNLALGAMNRAMPQLMVVFVGAPALALGGLALLLVALPVGLRAWLDAAPGFLPG